jgi:hypothetical protein
MSTKEILRRRQNRLCFHYNKGEYIIQECLYSSAIKPDYYTTIALTSSSPKPRIKEVKDSFNSKTNKRKDKLSL